MVIYPNLINEQVKIEGLQNEQAIELHVLDFNGSALLQQNIRHAATILNASHLPKGLYQLQL